ncbi:hypothetical protein WICPIJ_008834 [Wickerhamomyces pijperi]|uniref:ubiquitinyl hydrolase 1 n=1 Tax=Wickerhamomyces pijperi TaxID=599730 RepID=A0A9P8TH06_WICPI|nr:hypothetical protein WICPIJ_008834 [Wickerhamomyces pijperi]
MNIKDSKSPLFDALVDFFKEFVQKNEGKEFGENITPSEIYSAITAHNNFQHLQWGQQEDAEEFFGYLLDGLNEEFTESVKNLSEAEIKSLLNSILNDETRNNIKASIKKFNSPELESQENKVTTTSSTTVGEDGWQEVNNSKKIVSSSRREVEIKPSPINHLFGGQFRSTLKVPNEKHTQSITLDPFLQIQLDISDDEITSLTEAFKRISTIEELQYKANGGKDVIATKQTFIDRLPNVLIIHLKRFSFTNKTSRYGRIEKIRKVIEYKEKLSVPVECLSPAIRSTPAEYKLIGVVYHHGLNSDGGHYTVDVLRNGSGNKWIRIDDTNITSLELEHVLPNPGSEESKTAYILMYQRISA